MFYGHYCGAWIIKVLEPRIPLWILMVAVQFVDFLFSLFVLLGIEEVNVVRGFTKVNDLNLVSVPYTHSLIAVIGWSIVYGLLYRYSGYGGGNRAVFLVGLAVLSHWPEDLLVHDKDLLLLTIDDSRSKYGFGLWNYPKVFYPIEILLFYGSFYYYFVNTEVHPSKLHITHTTQPTQPCMANKWAIILLLDSLGTHFFSEYLDPPKNCKLLVSIMLLLYIKTAYFSHKLDKVRVTRHNNCISEKLKLLNE
ncbi:hypothetical protein C1645_787851 [Glomus cerebriforme]|uniref:Uncharacterized protein n=1 Tax=Glomus cerebriforme TaxID=658196 RepID=A0A397S8L6_9GLOM|nr:hypothetical protein C1645_787851 [Glomus cerebriforme]